METTRFGRTTIVIKQGDITLEEVDAVVNAANARLAGGGGVDGAIHRAGGPEIMKACDLIRRQRGGCPTGSAVLTTAGHMKAKHVIHAVGPIWDHRSAEECDRLLVSAYESSLRLAADHGLARIAFPSISTGIYGYPIERAAPRVLRTVWEFVASEPLDEIRFILFSTGDLDIYAKALVELHGQG